MSDQIPLVPPDVDLRGLPWMPLHTVRLMDSDINAISTGDEFRAAVRLWCKAWHQVPAGSLPDDDRILANLAGYVGARWKRMREVALRGFVKCSDGRLYHPVICEAALDAWKHRQAQRDKAAKRWGNEGERHGKPAGDVRADRVRAARSLATHTDAEWKVMLSACGSRCVKCGGAGVELVKDHIQPIAKGGSDGISNLQPLCHPCNSGRGGETEDLRPAGALDYVILQCHVDAAGMPRHSHGSHPAMQGTETVQGQTSASRRTQEPVTGDLWKAYSAAYKERYRVDPLRNAKVNGMLARFVERVPAAEAPEVAAFYVSHDKGLYVSSRHCVDLLLRDAEGLRTEWASGRKVHEAQARQGDRTAATGAVFDNLLAEAKRA